MAATFPYALTKEARLLYSSITQKSAPKGVQNATAKYSGTFGISKEDFDAIVRLEVEAIKTECGEFSGNPAEYYLACTSGETAANRVMAKAELDARGRSPDEAFKIKEKAEKRAELYRQFAGILQASSQFDVSLAKLENGAIKDIPDTEIARAQAGKDQFYPGAWVVPNIALKGFKRKTMDAKDGVTAYLQNVLFVRNGERFGGGGGAPNNEVFGGFKGYSPEDPTALAPGGEGSPPEPADADGSGF